MKAISEKSDLIRKKTNRLTLRIIEAILKSLHDKGITNYNSFLASELGTSRPYISRMLNGDGNITIKSLLRLLDAAGLEMEIKLYDRETLRPVEHLSITTVKLERPEESGSVSEVFNEVQRETSGQIRYPIVAEPDSPGYSSVSKRTKK